MKKLVYTLLIVLDIIALKANPVDVSTALTLGKSFVNMNFENLHRDADLSLIFTAVTDRNENCYYVFNVGQEGFIIISADDFYRPIIGYSENGNFDYAGIPPALSDYLDGIVEGRNTFRNISVAAPDVAADWRMLEKTGRLVSRNGGKGSEFLVKTKWNQDYPYNYCCPADAAGPGGHVYVGCLATAMAQLMRFWCYPINGIGSHCYYDGNYGQICADFGNTTYDWDNMPEKLTSSSSEAEKIAVGTLGFHCGVTIDMSYGPDGSGGGSIPIVSAMPTYFGYSDSINFYSRQDFELEPWCDMLKEHFDMGWPCYYGGCADGGCHAFVCDGYNDYDLFHFNLGWGGSADGWYIMDTSPYTTIADAMFNFVPQTVFDATPSAPTNLAVETISDESLVATVHWTNPTGYLNGTQLENIDRVIVTRNGKVAFEQSADVMPGQSMSFVDRVPYFDEYDYKVYVEADGRTGRQAVVKNVHFGPTCDWRIIMTTTNYQGWNGGKVSAYNMAGTEIGEFTMTSSTPQSLHVQVPIGTVSFGWTAPSDTLDNISFNIRDAENNKLYSFEGSTDQMPEGIFFVTNNNCGSEEGSEVPSELYAEIAGNDAVLVWDAVENQGYGYLVFRDGQVCYLSDTPSFTDADVSVGGHCYEIGVLTEGGWNGQTSNTACVTAGDGCNPATELWYYAQDNVKPVITWTKPTETTHNLSGYYVMRKDGDDGEYKQIKLLGPNKTEYKENSTLELGTYYCYQVIAYYGDIDCQSAPAKAKYGNEFFVRYHYSLENVEDNIAADVCIYPNPAKDVMTVKAENIKNVTVYNAVGQIVFEDEINDNIVMISLDGFESGLYLININAGGKESLRRISVIR